MTYLLMARGTAAGSLPICAAAKPSIMSGRAVG